MRKTLLLPGFLTILMWSTAAYATFNSGSTGADGAFSPTSNTVVTLPADGVLNYTTVNIPTGVTVTFQKNAKNTPAYMLATGDVTIAGTISVNAGNGTATDVGKGGPGGFDGGYGGTTYVQGGKGLGPGGGNPGNLDGCNWSDRNGGGGSFGTAGGTICGTAGQIYGTSKLLPLIGGSGGGGQGGSGSYQNGGGGGGALLIASSGSITVSGTITSNGGAGYLNGGSGSGGGIRLVANSINGNGAITAKGGTTSANGGAGRIRLEAYTNARTAATDPAYSYGLPGTVFVTNTPSLTITSIGGNAPPPSPSANYSQPDIMLPSSTTNPVAVNISAANIPVSTTVKVWVIPQYGTATSVNTTLTGTDQSSTGSASVNLSTTYSNIVTAEATFTIVAFNYEGEEIDKVRLATRLGGKSEITYIAKSGKEFKGELIAALVR